MHTLRTHTHSGKGVEGVEGRAHSKRDSDRTQCGGGGGGGEESRQARTGLRERERERGREGGRGGRERENSKTLFSKDCSLGSFRPV